MGDEARAARSKGGIGHTIITILGSILCIVFIPLIIMNMVLIIRSYTHPDKLPMVFGISPVIVMSGSMYPEFDAGDMIFIQKTDPAALQVGDVICYYPENDKETAVTHRIVEIQSQDGQPVFVTRGDANNTEDRIAVTYEMVQGRYMGFYIAGLGNIAVFLQSPAGMVICIVCPLGLLLLWDVVRRALSSRKKGKKAESMEAELERLRAQVAQQERSSSAGVGRNGGEQPPMVP